MVQMYHWGRMTHPSEVSRFRPGDERQGARIQRYDPLSREDGDRTDSREGLQWDSSDIALLLYTHSACTLQFGCSECGSVNA
jgi:hypothetical protein